MVGVVDDVLADRAFVEQRRTSAAELATLADLQGDAPSVAPHYVANALAAAALARAYGVPPVAVRDGLRAFVPDPHRIADVAVVDGVRFVDDSKATNPHAAAASLLAFEHVVWVAGGLLKGAEVDDLVSAAAGRLRGVVLIGADRARIAEALARHAPDVPVVDVPDTDTGAMDVVVTAAVALAAPGDVVLLAPAAASMDMFANYGSPRRRLRRGRAASREPTRRAPGIVSTTSQHSASRVRAGRPGAGLARRLLARLSGFDSPVTTYYLLLGATACSSSSAWSWCCPPPA